VVFLSSNQVFDGTRSGVPCNAATCPVSTYGRQKAQAEESLLERAATGRPIAILRLAKVVWPGMPLLRGWVDDLRAGRSVRAFTDMNMAPVPVETVARAVANLLGDRATGVFQLTGPRDISYAQVARHLAGRLGVDASLIDPVSAHSVGQPSGATPRHTTLDSSSLRRGYGLIVPDAFEVLEQALSLP
jgi:dTDP-4-dehydrorhamnose reductase